MALVWVVQAIVMANSALAASQVLEYGLKRSVDGRYHVYMRPNTALSGTNASLTGQVTIKVPTGTGANQFQINDLQSNIPSVIWAVTSRINAPVENNQVDFLSFTFTPTGSANFNFQSGVELEVFNFANPNTCAGSVTLLDNNESFALRPNSVGTNPANQFTNLGWGSFSTNNYLGNYSSSVSCGVNNNPVITSNGGGSSAAISTPENQSFVTTVTATDSDNDTLSFSISGGVDKDQFMIHPVTGMLSFINTPYVNHPLDANGDNVYQVQVHVSDGQGGTDTQDLAITVVKSNLYKVLEYTIRRSMPDGRYHVYMRPTMDPAAGMDHSLTGQLTLMVPHGMGGKKFTITNLTTHIPNVVWALSSRADAPIESANVDYLSFTFNPYGTQDYKWKKNTEIEVFSFDNSASCQGVVDVMENDDPLTNIPNSVNSQPANQFTNLGWGPMSSNNYLGNYGDPVDCNTNRPPVITSNGGGDTAEITTYDQQNGVTTVTATDADNDTLTYSIVGGVDADLFLINPNTGRLSFSTTPVFEEPKDADKNNEYLITVRAADGYGGIDEQILTIKVVKSTLYKVLEYTVRRSLSDGRYHVYMRPTRDPDANLNYNLTGQITLTVPSLAGANQFIVNDLKSTFGDVVWAQSSRVNAPTENTAIDYLSFTFSPYGHQSFNWQAGVEIEMFNFVNPNQCTGLVDVMENIDPFAKMPNSVNSRPANQFTNLGWGPATANNYLGNYGDPIDCHNNSAPIITSDGGGDKATKHISENTVAVTTVTATDADNDVLVYSISGGVDAAKFAVDPSTGALTFITAPDFENPNDANTDNTYEVQVTVADGQGGVDVQDISVIVDDVFENDPPQIISDGGGDEATISVIEGRTHATTVVATDANNDVLIYSIMGGADANSFTIDAATGVLSFKYPPSRGGQAPWGDMFIPPGDADQNNVYVVQVKTVDPYGASDNQIINVKLTSGLVLQLQLRAWLQGGFDSNTQLMRDSLRTKGLIPYNQPYNLPPFTYDGSEVASQALMITEGLDAPVDWVLVELRSSTAPATLLWRKAALIQRDGDIVDAVTGSDRLTVENAPAGVYYLAIEHRNHLGVVSASTILLENSVATWYDFGLPTTTVMGTNSRSINAGKAFLWAGDANYDRKINVEGTNNDYNTLLTKVNTFSDKNFKMESYNTPLDFNLDGNILFNGPMNDMNVLLANILTHPANTTKSTNHVVIGNLP
jgi:hypothetical protein